MTEPSRGFRERPVSFVRRSGRMSEAQERAWRELSPRFVIPVARDVAATSILPGSAIDPGATFGRSARLVVEIGSGQGHAIVHAAASDPGGPGAGLARARPPVFGPRRDRMQRQAQGWGAARLAQALEMLTDTDLQLRSAQQRAPAMALVERTLIRLSMLASARR